MKGEAEKRCFATRLAAIRAPELTKIVGRNQVLAALDQRWAEAKEQMGVEGALPVDFPSPLKNVMRNPISVQDATYSGKITRTS